MSDVPKISYPIGSKNVQGGLPTAILNALQFNPVTNQWEFVAFPAAGGEVNLGANVGAGTGLVFRDKTGVTLNFKSLLAGAGITITNNADDITITATGGGGGLGDLEFLRDKELAGDMILSNVAKTVIGVGASIIPAIGKTFFHVKSHLSPVGIASNNTRAELRNDGTRIDAMAYSSNNAVPDSTPGDSKVGVADSLIGDGAKAFDINIISLTGAPTINTSMQGWIQDT